MRKSGKLPMAAALAACICTTGAATHAGAGTYSVLHSICSQGVSCKDGISSLTPLLVDPTGSVFGVMRLGGRKQSASGALFSLVPDGGGYDYGLLHSFCGKPLCTDGSRPNSGLIMDVTGNLYGTADSDTVYELVLSGGSRHLVVLYRFCPTGGLCLDGSGPEGPLTYAGAASGVPYDGVSPLYGTTSGGGANNAGTLYQLTPPAPGQVHWREKVLHSFCSKASCRDGSRPRQGVTMDGIGNLFGTAQYGGRHGQGLVFEFSQTVPGHWRETVLHNSCAQPGCRDGREGSSPLALDGWGSLLGTMDLGGNSDAGVLFRLTPGAGGSAASYDVLHHFCAEDNCADGGQPFGALALGGSGEIFGTTVRHGAHGDGDGAGMIYRAIGSTLTVLYDFCTEAGCADGEQSQGGLAIGPNGELFGTTNLGGPDGSGTIFEFVP